MKWTPLKIYALKLAIFSIALLYLALDLLLFHGPVWRLLYPEGSSPSGDPPVAVVLGEPISQAQLQRHEAEQDALAGRTEHQASRRATHLMDLVRATLLRTRARYNDKNLPDCRAEAEAEVSRLATRCASDAEFTLFLASQGYTRQSFTDKVEARLRQQALLERAVAPACSVSDADLQAAYESAKDELTLPERRDVRHIFLATLHRDPAAVKAKAEALLARLQAGEDFGALAREASEDERSAPDGGALGQLTACADRPLPELPLFGADAIPAGVPALAQSRWGWHILLAGPLQPESVPSLDDCRDTLRTALQSARREAAVRQYFSTDIRDNTRQKRIQINLR